MNILPQPLNEQATLVHDFKPSLETYLERTWARRFIRDEVVVMGAYEGEILMPNTSLATKVFIGIWTHNPSSGLYVRFTDDGSGSYPIALFNENPRWSFVRRRVAGGTKGTFHSYEPNYGITFEELIRTLSIANSFTLRLDG